MSVDEAIESANDWIKGVTVYEGASGWRIACKVLADEVMQQRGQIEKMNADLLRFQDKIAALEAEVKEAYNAGYENGLNSGWIDGD